MGFCRDLGKSYLTLVNIVTFIGGLAVFILGLYAVVEEQNFASFPGFSVDLSLYASVGVLVIGVLIMLLSCMGYQGAKNDNKMILCLYIVFMFIFACIMIGAGASFLSYINAFEEIALIDSSKLVPVEDKLARAANDAQLAMFTGCCGPLDGVTSVPMCDDVSNGTVVPACVIDEPEYKIWLQTYNKETCEVAAKFMVSGHNLIGDPKTGACGGGDAKAFQKDVSTLVEEHGHPIGVTTLVLAGILILVLFFAIVLLCTQDREKKRREREMELAAQDATGMA